MTTFSPPTTLDVPPTSRAGTPQGNRLMRQFGSRPRGRSVLRVAGVYQTVDTPTQALIDTASEVYMGGRTYEVTAATAARLRAAGYEITEANTVNWWGPIRLNFDDPDLSTGVDLMTPAAGDLIVDIAFSVVTAFAGGSTLPALFFMLGADNLVGAASDNDPTLDSVYFSLPAADEGTNARFLASGRGSLGSFGARPAIVTASIPLQAKIVDGNQSPPSGAIDQTAGAVDVYVCTATPEAV